MPEGGRNLKRYVGFHSFGGVDFTSAPDEADCIDMVNVDSLERKGAVYTRPPWVPRALQVDNPVVAFAHGRVQSGSDSADTTVALTSPPGSDWISPFGPFTPMNLVSGELVPSSSSSLTGAAFNQPFSSEQEVYVTLGTLVAVAPMAFGLFAGISNPQSPSVTGYSVSFSSYASSGWIVQVKHDPPSAPGGSAVSFLPSLGQGDSIGLRISNGRVEAWHKPAAGDWEVIAYEELVAAPGPMVGLWAFSPLSSSVGFKDFGGGESTGASFPETSVLDDFNRSDEIPLGGAPSLVAVNRDTGASATRAMASSMFADAVQFSADSGSVILVTENVKTATNIGINVVEAQSTSPGVKITPMAYSTGPPDAPDLDYVRFLGVQHPDNRVAAAGVAKGQSHEARVWFSDPGDHTKWSIQNYVDLDPNDGEVFTGITNWRGQLWVFKETKAFVFYGNSVDQFGGPEFNYRAIDLGTRAVPRNLSGAYAMGPAIATGENGIYFVARDGIYLVDGRDSVKVSGSGDLLGSWGSVKGGPIPADVQRAGLHYHQRRLYVNTGQRIFVWDELRRGWLVWLSPLAGDGEDMAAAVPWIGGTSHDDTTPAITLAGHPDATRLWGLAKPSEAAIITTDGDSPIPARYRLGFSDFGSDYEDRLEETRVTGTGEVKVTVSKDFESSGLSETLELTDPPSRFDVPEQRRFKHGLSGVVFSTELEGEAPWSVHRVVHAVTSQKAGGTR